MVPKNGGVHVKKLVDRFPVNPIKTGDIIPVRAGYQQCAPGYLVGPDCRDSYTIQYVYNGCGVVRKNGQSLPVHATEIFILHPGEEFEIEADILNPWNYIWIGFRSSLELPELDKLDVFPAKNLENLFLEIANCNRSANRPLEFLLLSYIWKLIFRIKQMNHISTKKPDQAEDYVERACLLIHDHYADMNINQLAHELQLNRSYLSRIFKQNTGLSIKTYLTNVRLQAAKTLLLQKHTISETSILVGYADIASFSRAFKAYYKFSPTQYLQLNEQNNNV